MRDGAPLQLTVKALDTLLFLLCNQGATVTKSEIMNAVWPDSAVEENNLTQQISALRRALGERPGDHRFIVTVPGRGYCFVASAIERESSYVASVQIRRLRLLEMLKPHFDESAVRGYSLAIAQILLVVLAFAWSAITHYDPAHPQSLAVLNFKASATGDEFIGNGISETLRARLGSVEDLTIRVAPADRDALAAGRQLQVDTVVTGSVQRDQNRIRVAVEMLSVADGRIVWGKTFDESEANIFALQDAIAGEVAGVLNVKFSSEKIPDRDESRLAYAVRRSGATIDNRRRMFTLSV
jgi:DNA-binding winged helix-turn-helix (wHTH) protein/TolB-like protein